jgi:hypothetical protein
MITTLKFSPGAGGGCLSIAKSVSRVDRRRTGVLPGGMLLDWNFGVGGMRGLVKMDVGVCGAKTLKSYATLGSG